MVIGEQQLKQELKTAPKSLYVLYGEESYLVEYYARKIAATVTDGDADAFDLQRFDGQETGADVLEEAVEAMPMLSERKCVLVRDANPAGEDADRLAALAAQVPDTCVLVFWQITVQPDKKKGWTNFLKAAETAGSVVKFDRLTAGDAVRLLMAGAKRRGCLLESADARYLIERAGNDLNLLMCELDKLSALAEDGVITRALIDRAATQNLEARVFDLSKAILQGRTAQAFALLHQLSAQREEPIAILGVLSNAVSDWYRAKIAVAGGATAASLSADFKSYKGKEFRLTNASRDAASMTVPALRAALDVLAKADTAMKLGQGDDRILLEQTVARLIKVGGNR